MEAFKLAIVLIVVISCVMTATRPVTPRKRTSTTGRQSRPARSQTDSANAVHLETTSRNHWDRRDLIRAIGRDDVGADGFVSIWPTP